MSTVTYFRVSPVDVVAAAHMSMVGATSTARTE